MSFERFLNPEPKPDEESYEGGGIAGPQPHDEAESYEGNGFGEHEEPKIDSSFCS